MVRKTKTAQVVDFMKQDEWKKALKIAKTFTIGVTREQRATLTRAFEAYDNGYFYEQMKWDPNACINAGIDLLVEKYGRFLNSSDYQTE